MDPQVSNPKIGLQNIGRSNITTQLMQSFIKHGLAIFCKELDSKRIVLGRIPKTDHRRKEIEDLITHLRALTYEIRIYIRLMPKLEVSKKGGMVQSITEHERAHCIKGLALKRIVQKVEFRTESSLIQSLIAPLLLTIVLEKVNYISLYHK